MSWTQMDTWVALTGALVGAACAIPGTYLVLMRNSLFGDAVSHAVLPGLAAAFLLSGSRDPTTMLAGAVVAGTATAFLSELIQKYGGVDQSASLGVVFCSLFALGLILIRVAADHVDLDPDCVLYGTIETAVIDFQPIPRVVITSALLLGVNLLVCALLWKELRITAFDPQLAHTLGLRPGWIRQLIHIMTAVTAVFAFESVGSILVIALLVAPATAAGLLSKRLPGVFALSLLFALAAAPIGHALAVWVVPRLAGQVFGQPFDAVSSAGMIAVTTGLLFCAAALAHLILRRLGRQSADLPPDPSQ